MALQLKELNILLVEDDEVDVMNVKRAFKKNNITNPVTVARDGVEAINLLAKPSNFPDNSLPNIILLDINMPRMNGIEFLKTLRATPNLKHISVFVLTTSNEQSDILEAYNFNVAGYILKPIIFDNFINAVKTLNSYWLLTELP